MKLGKLAVRHDERTLKLAKYLTALPPLPSSVDWYSDVPVWPMLKNDTIGDCTICTVAHTVQAWTRASHGVGDLIPVKKVIKAYSAVSGYRPGHPTTDRGAELLTVMNYWRKTGVGRHKIKAYAAVDFANASEVKMACYLFGSVPLGIALPTAIQSLTAPGSVWDIPPGQPLTGDWAAGSWGGHAIPIIGYTSDGKYVFPSWNGLYSMTQAFFSAYVEESYAPLGVSDWTKAHVAPNGINAQALYADLQAVTAA